MPLQSDVVSGNDKNPFRLFLKGFFLFCIAGQKTFFFFCENMFEKIACFIDIFITLFANRHIVR